MRLVLFSARTYERSAFEAANASHGHELVFRQEALCAETAPIAAGAPCACIFVNDRADAAALRALRDHGVRLLALRSAGFNHVDMPAAHALGLTVARVPAYSPEAVAEHAAALLLTLNRKTHRAFNRVREQNFSLDGLVGFNLHGKTVGVIGMGQIGRAFARIMLGFGCRVWAHDPAVDAGAGMASVTYVSLAELWRAADLISLHCPLTPETRHLINVRSLAAMKPGVTLINTGRGALIDSRAVIDALKSDRLGAVGIDVYEEEEDLFFRDLSGEAIHDDVFVRLLTFPNVLVTGHQAFLTREAIAQIADTTLANVTAFERGALEPDKQVLPARLAAPAGQPGGSATGAAPSTGARGAPP